MKGYFRHTKIIATLGPVTESKEMLARLITEGVEPFLIEFSEDNPEQTIADALAFLKNRQWTKTGDWLVVITNALADEKVIDTLQVRQVE